MNIFLMSLILHINNNKYKYNFNEFDFDFDLILVLNSTVSPQFRNSFRDNYD